MQDRLPLILLLAVGTAFSLAWLILQRKRLNMVWCTAILIALLHTLYGVFTVKAFAFMETGFQSESLGNMSLFGGVFFMPLAYWLGSKIFKRNPRDVFDIFTPCMIVTVMCARVNCILSGCCHGWTIPGTNGLQWPTRELEILFYIVLLVFLVPKIQKKETNGTAYPIYMAAYGAFRFIIEFFRASDSHYLFHIAHLWAALALGLGLSIYFEFQKNNKPRRKTHA